MLFRSGLRLRRCQVWWAGFGLGVCAAKNLRKHARAALVCLTGFCGHAPFCDFFIAHPLPQSLQGMAGAPLKSEYRSPKTERPNARRPKRPDTVTRVAAGIALQSCFGTFQEPNTALASMGYAQAAIECIVNTSSRQNYKAMHYRLAVFGIRYSQANQPSLQATGEWVGDEKIAERRVATKASQTSQSSPRVFSEIFCSTHHERGASQPTWQVPQSETLASQPCKFPRTWR